MTIGDWIRSIVLLSTLGVTVGCGDPTPTASKNGAPPPPPVPAPEPEPAPPPPKPEPDPYEVAMREVGTIVERYGTLYSSVRDEATGDKAVEEIDRLTARLRELTETIGKLPSRPGEEKHALAFQTHLTRLQTAALSNADMQRVLGDLDLQLKFIPAHQAFVTEGLLPLGQAIAARQPNLPKSPEQPPPPSEGKPNS
jgi:hypothetical protein